MAIGDAAKAAGMDVVLPTDDRRDGYLEINRTRDEIAVRQSQQVRNASAPANELFLYWDAARGHLAARVDISEIGHLALTEDVRLTRSELQAQLTELFSRVYALEHPNGANATSTTTNGASN